MNKHILQIMQAIEEKLIAGFTLEDLECRFYAHNSLAYYNHKNLKISKDNKYPFIVYWWNKNCLKWRECSTLEKAERLKQCLVKQNVVKVWIAKDVIYE